MVGLPLPPFSSILFKSRLSKIAGGKPISRNIKKMIENRPANFMLISKNVKNVDTAI